MRRKEGLYLSVKVSPLARKRRVKKISPSEYKVSVLSPPTKGKANKELIEILSSHFSLPSSQVKIVKGERSRQKTVLLEAHERGYRRNNIKNLG